MTVVCPICKSPAQEHLHTGDATAFHCPTHGDFKVADSVLAEDYNREEWEAALDKARQRAEPDEDELPLIIVDDFYCSPNFEQLEDGNESVCIEFLGSRRLSRGGPDLGSRDGDLTRFFDHACSRPSEFVGLGFALPVRHLLSIASVAGRLKRRSRTGLDLDYRNHHHGDRDNFGTNWTHSRRTHSGGRLDHGPSGCAVLWLVGISG